MSDLARGASLKRALTYTAAASAVVPLFGLLTAPLLTHGLGVDGRGATSAALAPGALIAGIASLGMPEAVTYFVAARRARPKRVVLVAAVAVGVATAFGLIAVLLLAGVLSGGSRNLADLIIVGTVLNLPGLAVGVARGLAIAEAQWHLVTIERLVSAIARLVALAVLYASGALTVTSAVVVLALAPVLAGGVYILPFIRTLQSDVGQQGVFESVKHPAGLPEIVRYGLSTWIGSAAVVLLARMSQVVVTPLSDVNQLGLLAVAITVADVPFLLATAVRDAAFGVFSSTFDPARIASATRLTLLITTLVSVAIGGTLPLWINLIFGVGFEGAIVPTWITLISQCLSVPYIILGAGLAANGRPFVRSLAITGSLLVNIILLFVLVPPLGAAGAALAGVAGNILATTLVLRSARLSLKVSYGQMLVPSSIELLLLWRRLSRTLIRLVRRSEENERRGS